MKINWTDPNCPISKHFTVKDALYLPSFKCYHIPTEEEKQHILALAVKLDLVCDFVGLKMIVHCWIRPLKVCSTTTHNGENYNEFVGSTSPNGGHPRGQACDYHFEGKETAEECQEMRLKIAPKLKEFGLRLEDRAGKWLHNDDMPVKSKRFFKP